VDTRLVVRALAQGRQLGRRDRWTREQVVAYQSLRLAELRRWAVSNSPFYARHHAGLQDAPLEALPCVTKSQLMDAFDDVLTAPSLRRDLVESHLREVRDTHADPGPAWQGRWRAASTAGTTGVRGVFVWDEHEWARVIASYGRATTWAGVAPGPTSPQRLAVVSSLDPTHQSAVVAASVRSALVPTLRLDANAPLQETVDALNRFQPRVLVGYASALRRLAFAQIDGTLRIRPRAVMSASEVLSAGAAQTMATAWGSAPVDVYAATETAGIASSCEHGRRHTYDDLVIVEPVDGDGAPVPPHSLGARLWVTVLFSRTLPLIRYELSDRVALSSAVCPCGRPFGILEAVEGRAEDTLTSGVSGGSELHADVVRSIVEQYPVEQWQVADAAASGVLRVRVVPHRAGLDTRALREALEARLTAMGQSLRVEVHETSAISRTSPARRRSVRPTAVRCLDES